MYKIAYVKVSMNIKCIKIKLILLESKNLYALIVENDNSKIFLGRQTEVYMLTQMISNNLQSNAIRFKNK